MLSMKRGNLDSIAVSLFTNNIMLSNFNSTIDKFFRQIDDSIPADMILKTGQN